MIRKPVIVERDQEQQRLDDEDAVASVLAVARESDRIEELPEGLARCARRREKAGSPLA